MAAMLDYNPKLEVGFEKYAFDYLLGEKLTKGKSSNLKERLSNFHNACRTESSDSKQYWGNKITTEQIAALEKCENAQWPVYLQGFIKNIIEGQKVIFIVRDGRSCVQSKMKRTDQTYATALQRWKTSIDILEFFQSTTLDLHVCKYEDLLKKPKEELIRLCSFLDVSYDESMLQGPSNPIMPDIYKAQGLRPIKEETWPEQWEQDMFQELQKLGYLNEA